MTQSATRLIVNPKCKSLIAVHNIFVNMHKLLIGLYSYDFKLVFLRLQIMKDYYLKANFSLKLKRTFAKLATPGVLDKVFSLSLLTGSM